MHWSTFVRLYALFIVTCLVIIVGSLLALL
jgi:hypothetical protein